MAETASVGRPTGYEEPVVKRNFDIPKSLNARLVTYSKRTKKPAVRIVQDALNRVLPPDPASETSEEHESPAAGITSVELESTLRAVFSDVTNSVPVSVDRTRRGKLQDLADQLGFASVEDLLQTLAFQAIEHPSSAASFLFAGLEESAIIAAQTEEHHAKARRNTKSSKAA